MTLILAIVMGVLFLVAAQRALSAQREVELLRLAVAELIKEAEALRAEGDRLLNQAFDAGVDASSHRRIPKPQARPSRGASVTFGPAGELDVLDAPAVETESLAAARDALRGLTADEVEVCFTGWLDSEKMRMQAAAAEAGWTVRAAVAKHLSLLVVGPTPGKVKLRDAKAQNVCLISGEVFQQLLREGWA